MCKVLALAPDEYWRLTPAELTDMLVGAAAREDRAWTRTAWMTAYLLNVSGKIVKKEVTVDGLLGRARKVTAPRDPATDFEELWRRVEGQRAKGNGGG